MPQQVSWASLAPTQGASRELIISLILAMAVVTVRIFSDSLMGVFNLAIH